MESDWMDGWMLNITHKWKKSGGANTSLKPWKYTQTSHLRTCTLYK